MYFYNNYDQAEPSALTLILPQVSDRPVERLQHQATFRCRPALQPSVQRLTLCDVQLPATGELG